MKRIQTAWEGYAEMVIPKDAPEIQHTESRKAFFAGAAVLFGHLMNGLSAGPDSQPQDSLLLLDIEQELNAFGLELDRAILKHQTH